MQAACFEPCEAERFQEGLWFTEEFPGDEGADADHLEAVVGVSDDGDVAAEPVEHREAVWREAADAA